MCVVINCTVAYVLECLQTEMKSCQYVLPAVIRIYSLDSRPNFRFYIGPSEFSLGPYKVFLGIEAKVCITFNYH